STRVRARRTVDIGRQDSVNHLTEFYKESPLVRVLAERLPDTKSVAGTNFCDLAPRFDHRARRIVVTSVIDNLVKGASGQAIQNMNVRFGLAETAGLWHPGFTP